MVVLEAARLRRERASSARRKQAAGAPAPSQKCSCTRPSIPPCAVVALPRARAQSRRRRAPPGTPRRSGRRRCRAAGRAGAPPRPRGRAAPRRRRARGRGGWRPSGSRRPKAVCVGGACTRERGKAREGPLDEAHRRNYAQPHATTYNYTHRAAQRSAERTRGNAALMRSSRAATVPVPPARATTMSTGAVPKRGARSGSSAATARRRSSSSSSPIPSFSDATRCFCVMWCCDLMA